MSRLRWGILATGWIADLFTGDLRQNGFTVAAVASRSADKAAAFALYPTQMSDLIAVADAGAIMPPKSTWFEPKLADGLVSHVLD